MTRSKLDLPEPDSPTKPTVSPACTDKETPSTARNGFAGCHNERSPARIFAHDVVHLQYGGRTGLRRCCSFGCSAACRQERCRIGIARPAQDLCRWRLLDNLAPMHHRDAIGELRNHRKIVAHQNHPHASSAHRPLQQQQHLRLGDDVQSRGGLIRDDNRRRQNHCHGDSDPLALSAGEFVRQPIERPLLAAAIRLAPVLHAPASRLGRLPDRAIVRFPPLGRRCASTDSMHVIGS